MADNFPFMNAAEHGEFSAVNQDGYRAGPGDEDDVEDDGAWDDDDDGFDEDEDDENDDFGGDEDDGGGWDDAGDADDDAGFGDEGEEP